jgi:FkbM family methyltransferase
MFGHLVNRLLQKFGYRLIGQGQFQRLCRLENYKPSDDVLTEHLRRVFSRHEVDCVFDVGANDGAYARNLRQNIGFQGFIFSFEPIPRQVAALEAAASGDSRWIVCPWAMGSRAGEEDFHVMSSDVFSSFLLPDASQPQKYTGSNKVAQTLRVPMRTVADVWEEMRVKHGLKRMYLKMDTQGFDLNVFAGAKGALQSIPALQSELAFRPIYEGAPDASFAMDIFRKASYVPSLIHSISFDESLTMIEADGVFVRATSA